MEPIKVAINGFGRIGRLTARILLQDPRVRLVAINDLSNASTLAHLLEYDSLHRRYAFPVEAMENSIVVNDQVVYVYNSKDPASLPWKDLGVDVVLECTGIFTKREDLQKHLAAGAKKVILSAPPKGGDIKQIVLGINDHTLTTEDAIISNASCTTNCAAPMVAVLEKHFGIQKGILTTVHAYTGDQRIHDAPHSDLRRARTAAANIIPTSTGASKALEAIFPSLKGKLMGSAIRVPVPTGSITELTLLLEKEASMEQINTLFKQAAEQDLQGILEYSTAPLVSTDIIGNSNSTIFDSGLTIVMGNLVKISAWYDNEIGYSSRMAELTVLLATR